MVTRSRTVLRDLKQRIGLRTARLRLRLRDMAWLGPVVMALIITVLHFSYSPNEMFWHDLLRRAYYVVIVWAIYLYGLRGGAVAGAALAAVFAVHLLIGWGDRLHEQADQIYDIVGYLAVGIGVGFVVDRARALAVRTAQRKWDISLRGVLTAAIHELKPPMTDVRAVADDLAANNRFDTWESSIGRRLHQDTDAIEKLRHDLVGIVKILSSRSTGTRPYQWANGFARDESRGGQYGPMVATTDPGNPPPALWPISPSVLDELMRCLLDDMGIADRIEGFATLSVGSEKGCLVIAFSSRCSSNIIPPDRISARTTPRGWVRMKLLELVWNRYGGTIEPSAQSNQRGFRIVLPKPKVGGVRTNYLTGYRESEVPPSYKPARVPGL